MHIDDIRLGIEVIVPDIFQLHGSRHHFPGMPPEIFEQLKSARLQHDDRAIAAHFPRKRIGDPAQLDSTLLYLCGPSSDAVTGTVIQVDDGQSTR